MADYGRYKTDTLRRMRCNAFERYCLETEKPVGNWGDGMRRSKLPSIRAWEKAKERLDEIDTELKRRDGMCE